MGDIIHSLPAAAALRQAFPHAMIGWVVEERWADLLCAPSARREIRRSAACPVVDAIHIASTRAWRCAPFSSSTRKQFVNVIRETRLMQYKIAIDLQAAIRSAALCCLSRAPQRVGFAKPREPAAKWFYTQAVETSGVHVVEQGMELAREISGRCDLIVQFSFPVDAEAEAWADAELRRRGIHDFVIMNPGAGWGAKRWPVERYAELAKVLAKDGLATVMNLGPGEEKLALSLEEKSSGAAQAIASSLSQLIALVRRAKLFIGGDTGPVHLAAALGIPVVAIYGPTNPARNGPFGPNGSNHNSIKVLRNSASQTSHARRSAPDSGLLQITVEQVAHEARKLLEIPA